MYFLALLFFLGCIFNLFFGDLDEAVWGLAISIVLSAGTYFWVMEDEKFTNRIRLPIIITVVIFGGAFGLTKALEEIEINAEKYVLVTKIRNSFPETAQLIQIGMEDKKISILEYQNIQKQYQKLRKDNAKQVLSNPLDSTN